MQEDKYQALKNQGYDLIALTDETLADLDTPLSIYLKLAAEKGKPLAHSFLLESVEGGERFGRYSFIGLPASTIITASGFGEHAITKTITNGKITKEEKGNPLEIIEKYQQNQKIALPENLEQIPRFCGGLAGYFGYDTIRYIEKKLEKTCPPDELGCPDILLMQTNEIAVLDNLSGKIYLIVYANAHDENGYQKAKQRLKELREKLRQPVQIPHITPQESAPINRPFNKKDYLEAVEKAKELIRAGDFMQVQIGQRINKKYQGEPLNLYRALRSLNPSPYMYFYDMGEFQIIGSSPEILVRHQAPQNQNESAKITIRPLAGTRPRGATQEKDKQTEKELLADPKERAEHVMLIDLARNDIGRIAKIGTVKVTDAFAIERYSHVMHIVSNVEGELKDGMTSMDVLKASFPAGTLSGAPKVHAMEIIDELEPTKRGLYGGACGYISYEGNMDLAIAIRTAIIKNQTLYAQAAAGIVADSIPEMEWLETEHKAKALIKASELVEAGI